MSSDQALIQINNKGLKIDTGVKFAVTSYQEKAFPLSTIICFWF